MFVTIQKVLIIVFNQVVIPHRTISIIGIFLFLSIVTQVITGIVVSFSFVCEPMLVPLVREEEDSYDLYTDDFFWLHERGVDYIFIFMYLHLFRKMYLRSYSYDQETAWKSGSISFLIIHAIIFFGLVLCCTHLSDITLTIAANIIKTVCMKYGKLYWIIFTDQTLNTDTIIRLAYLHYILPFYLLYIGFIHAMDMHYGWKDSSFFSNNKVNYFWSFDVLKNELFSFINIILFFIFICLYLYSDNEPLSYEIFMWGDLGIINDVRFLSVAPHWYFRPYMGWLILCPHHYIGIFGLIYFMVSFYFQPNLQNYSQHRTSLSRQKAIVIFEASALHKSLFSLFILSVFYTGSFLPYGRFYISINGNLSALCSYIYVYVYLSFPLILVYRYNSVVMGHKNINFY